MLHAKYLYEHWAFRVFQVAEVVQQILRQADSDVLIEAWATPQEPKLNIEELVAQVIHTHWNLKLIIAVFGLVFFKKQKDLDILVIKSGEA